MLQLLATPEVGVFFKLRNECLMQLAGTNVADTKIREVSPIGAQKAKRSGSDLKDSPPRKRRRKRSPVDQGVGSQDDRLRQSQSAGTIGLQVVKVALCPPRALPLGASRSAPDLTYPRSPGPPIATSRRLGESASTSNMLEVAQPGAIQTVPAKRQAPAMKDKPSTRRKMDVMYVGPVPRETRVLTDSATALHRMTLFYFAIVCTTLNQAKSALAEQPNSFMTCQSPVSFVSQVQVAIVTHRVVVLQRHLEALASAVSAPSTSRQRRR